MIQEAVGRSTGGYAGLFDPKAGEVEIAYFADDPVVLHEAAHSWFNGSLLADRWANEAFASYYGFEAAKDLGVEGKPDTLTPELEAARIPLNAWRAGRSRGHEDRGLCLCRLADPGPCDRRAGRRRRAEGGLGRCDEAHRGVSASSRNGRRRAARGRDRGSAAGLARPP